MMKRMAILVFQQTELSPRNHLSQQHPTVTFCKLFAERQEAITMLWAEVRELFPNQFVCR
jgi:hypothetical protein